MTDLDSALRAEQAQVEEHLARLLSKTSPAPRLDDAMRYSILGGGKRLRPILCLWTHDAVAPAGEPTRPAAAWSAALSLELLHGYSLIHDDLPAMDDDDLRRGQPSCHRRFDEATAILAGDALQTEAFAVLADVADPPLAARLVLLLAQASGRQGMAGGQQLDLGAATGEEDVAAMERIHRLKTGRLLGAAMAMGAACAGADRTSQKRWAVTGEQLGLAFQIQDDVLDDSASSDQLGKSAGKDRAQGKLTAVSALGRERALAQAEELLRAAEGQIEELAPRSDRLRALARRLVRRDR